MVIAGLFQNKNNFNSSLSSKNCSFDAKLFLAIFFLSKLQTKVKAFGLTTLITRILQGFCFNLATVKKDLDFQNLGHYLLEKLQDKTNMAIQDK